MDYIVFSFLKLNKDLIKDFLKTSLIIPMQILKLSNHDFFFANLNKIRKYRGISLNVYRFTRIKFFDSKKVQTFKTNKHGH